MLLSEIDSIYNLNYRQLYHSSKDILEKLKDYSFNLEETEITNSILNRMWSYYETHDNMKILLGKEQKQASSDYFVECCLFFLKAYFEQNAKNITIKAEKIIWKEGRRNIRPDITFWRGEELIAVIEAKVQLGRRRKEWRTELINRESEIKDKIPGIYFAVICFTENNWQGFERDENFGTKYFSLTNKEWKPIKTSIEMLIKQIMFYFSERDLVIERV